MDKDDRANKLLLSLTYALHQATERYAISHPELKIGCTAAIVTAEPGIYKPIGSAEMILICYVKENLPVLLRWFDHYRL